MVLFHDRRKQSYGPSSSSLFRILFIGIVAVFVVNLWILFVYFPPSSSSPQEQSNIKNSKIDCPFYGCPIYPPEITNPQINSTILNAFLLEKNDNTLKFATDSYALLSSQGKSHIVNQDRAVFISPFLPELLLLLSPSSSSTTKVTTSTSFLAAIFDGHGKLGHTVAQEIVERFPVILAEKLTIALRSPLAGGDVDNNKGIKGGDQSIYKTNSKEHENVISIEDYDRTDFAIRKALNESFLEVNDNGTASTFSLGGCTASVSLRWGSKLYMANAGDSQIIIVSSFMPSSSSQLSSSINKQQQRTPEGMITKVEYSTRRDKANLPDERARIEGLGGKIHVNDNGFDPRVIIHSEAAKDTIGLAMSRSLGDWEWKSVGVIAEPIVDVIDLSKLQSEKNEENESLLSDQKIYFLIAASDGFFDIRQKEFYANQIAGSFLVGNDDMKYIHDNQRKQGVSLGGLGIKGQFRPLFRLYDIFQRITPKVQKGYRDDITAIIVKI
ncbi:MAG: serine/threonine protein phosphatase PrpC [Bacillariaceae sp.]|jgi:serine/threonine protein phosphatase PrpC